AHRPAPAGQPRPALRPVRPAHRLPAAKHRHGPVSAACDLARGPGRCRRRGHVPGQARQAGPVPEPCPAHFLLKSAPDSSRMLPMSPVLSGPHYLRHGLRLVVSPGLRLFVLLPLLVNLLLFAALIGLAVRQFGQWVDYFMPSLPDWLAFLEYLLWPLFVALVLLIVFFTFTLLANLIAAPFNGFLAEKVEVVERGEDPFPAFSWGELLAMVPRTLGRELRKLAYFLPRALALLILSLIPGLNLVAAPLWLLFGIWMMAVQYIDYPADNNKVSWQDMLAWLRARRWQSLSFGGIAYAALLIPGLNILMMPAAVAGATVFWVREGGRG